MQPNICILKEKEKGTRKYDRYMTLSFFRFSYIYFLNIGTSNE